MNSIIERYWHHVFKDYQVAPRKFVIPSFPDPLMSADFNQQNFVSKQAEALSFRLGVSQTTDIKPGLEYQIMPLADAANLSWYEAMLREGFPNESDFLCQLTSFLLTTNATYLNISTGKGLNAMTNLAIAEDMALIFNGVVSLSSRGQGMAGSLFQIARYEAFIHGAKELFFWTKHEGLARYSDSDAFYNIKTNV